MRRIAALLLVLLTCPGCDGCEGAGGGAVEREPSDEGASPSSAQQWIAKRRVEWPPTERREAIAEGREVIERLECNRCHAIDAIDPSSRPTHCTGCHQFLLGLEPGDRVHGLLVDRYGAEVVERYRRNIEHYRRVPSLDRIAARIEPAFLSRYIADPWDLRPMLEETMVWVKMSEAEREAIVRYFAAVAEAPLPEGPEDPSGAPSGSPPPSAARLREGERLFRERGCNGCHMLGNRDLGKSVEELSQMGLAAALAPNLRFTRERMDPEIAVAWIVDPRAFASDTLMPPMGVSPDEARAIRDFIYHADPELLPTPPTPSLTPPPPVDRRVGWQEVKERVLGRICVHCHMNDHEKDPGPGNVGGFGWPGTSTSMRTYEFLVRGALYDGSTRRSILLPETGGTSPPIVAAMMRRRVEALRDHVPPFGDHPRPDRPVGPPGMPMGLPPMSDEEIGIVRRFIADGCPGPASVTGMPGIRDGYLVPDGPIEDNAGCEARPPSESRPAWASAPPPPWERERGASEEGNGPDG